MSDTLHRYGFRTLEDFLRFLQGVPVPINPPPQP
jgi:hypothetical protein